MSNLSLVKGDLFLGRSQTVSVTVNCVGVMGKGIALQAKKLYPEVDERYRYLCKHDEMKLGEPVLIKRLVDPWILLFPTKAHWRSESDFAEVFRGLEYLKSVYKDLEIQSLAIPPLGCGLGGLRWDLVAPAFIEFLQTFDIPVELYVPDYNLVTLDESNSLHVPANVQLFSPSAICFAMALDRAGQLKSEKMVDKSLVLKIGYFINVNKFANATQDVETVETMKWSQLITLMVQNGLLQEENYKAQTFFKAGKALAPYWKATKEYYKNYTEYIERLARLLISLDIDNLEVAKTVHHFFCEHEARIALDQSLDQLILNFHRKNARWSKEKTRRCVSWLKKENWLP